MQKPPKILNLFGYTGGATLAAAAAGAALTHVDASRAMVTWCSENARLSGLAEAPIRYLVEDSMTFLQREIRRGNRYDAVIMDPPSYGRGKGGQLWKLSEHLPSLLDATLAILSDAPLFILLNTYSDSFDAEAGDMLETMTRFMHGSLKTVPLGLTGRMDGKFLPLGKAHRWTA
jgi:23S rRNA (cytosine1962-C5)-methyltransferase